MIEIGSQTGFREGEIRDAFTNMGLRFTGRGSRLLGPEQQTCVTWKFVLPEEPEYRDLDAFDFIYSEFSELSRDLGQTQAHMERDVLVSRAVSRGIHLIVNREKEMASVATGKRSQMRWTPEEDRQLIEMEDAKATWGLIAITLERGAKEVQERSLKLRNRPEKQPRLSKGEMTRKVRLGSFNNAR